MLALVLTATVRIGVFGLFHPVEVEVQPLRGNILVVESEGKKQILQGSDVIKLHAAALVQGRDGGEAAFRLSVPGKIRREFHGRLEIRRDKSQLLAIVEMDRETAVASVVAAEMPRAPAEAQKAQAVVARSFLTSALGRHPEFDFCDTTHCQFLREPPPEGSAAVSAQRSTRALVLAYQGKILAALYSAECGGRTRTLEEAGWHVEEYPYFAVDCLSTGSVSGHQIGMCQNGAAAMARRGRTFREILNHYFPATSIVALDQER